MKKYPGGIKFATEEIIELQHWVSDEIYPELVQANSNPYDTSSGKPHNGKCNGDCANCPPHYGYRHGRWYYGHGHIEGCEFGGNKGDGGRD